MDKTNRIAFLTLIKLQFKNKTSFSFKANKTSLILRIILYFIFLGGITTGLYFLFDLFSKRSLFGLFVLPIYYFNFLFIFSFIVVLITSIVKFSEDLYISPDNQFLITLPLSLNKVFLSKIIVYYLTDLLRNFLIFIPLLYSYGIVNNFRIGYYFWIIFILLFILMIPVLIASLFSVLIYKIKIWLRTNQLSRNFILILLFLTIFLTVIILFALLPKELRLDETWQTVVLPRLKNGTLLIEKIFYPITLLSMLSMGYKDSKESPYRLSGFSYKTSYLLPLLLIFLTLCFFITYFFIKKWFIKNITSSNEHKKTLKNSIYKYKQSNLSYFIKVRGKNENEISDKELIRIVDNIYFNTPDLFLKNNIDKILESIEFLKSDYIIEKLNKPEQGCIAIFTRHNNSHLICVLSIMNNKLKCYDTYKFSKKNYKKPFILSSLYKDFIRDFRTSSYLAENLAVILAPATLVFALNKIFSGFKLSVFGSQLVFTFEIFLELIVLFIYTLRTSSLYSKDKKSSYILKSSPIKNSYALSIKLFHEFVIGLVSILLLILNFYISTPLENINFICLFLMFMFLFVFNLIVCAEIDLRNINKFNNTAKTSEKVVEQNEIYASLFSVLFAALFSFVSFLIVKNYSNLSTLILMTISLGLLVINIILFPFISRTKHKKKEKTK